MVWDGRAVGDDGFAVPIDPPATSPAIVSVTGNATGLMVVTSPILPSERLDFLIDGVTVAADQRTTVLNLTTDGTDPLELPPESYTVTVLARNDAGPATGGPSAGVTASLDPGMTPEMVTAILVAGFILAGAIQIGSVMTLDQAGLTITHPDGRQTYFRADGSGNQLVGQAILDAATILGNLTVLGQTNFLNGLLTLGTGVGNPTTKPGVTTSYDSVPFTTSGPADPDSYRRGLFWTGTQWLVASDLPFLAHTTHFNTAGANTFGGDFMPAAFAPLGGVVKIGTSYYVLGKDGNRAANWYVYIFNSSWVKTGEWTLGAASDSNTIGTDGTDVLIGRRTSAGALTVYHFSTAGAVLSSRTCGTWAGADLTGVHELPVDTGTARFVVSSTTSIRVFNTSTGARITGEEWTPATTPVDGLGHDGTNWFTHTGTGIYEYTNLIGTYDFGFTWVDSDAGGAGTAETMVSALRTLAPTKRAKWTVSLPSAPYDDGTTDGANTASLYAAPTTTTLVLQTALAEGTLSATYSTLATSGAAPPGTNGFAVRIGALGRIITAALHGDGDPMVDVDGTGANKAGPLVYDATGHALGRNSRLLVSAHDATSGDVNVTSTTNATLTGLSIPMDCPGTAAVYEVTMCADVDIITGGTINVVELLVDGVAETGLVVTKLTNAGRATGAQQWRVTGLAAGTRTFTARTRNTAGSTSATVKAVNTTMFVKQI